MKTRVQKWGNSIALRIPRSFADDLRLAHNTLVEITLDQGRMVVTPVVESPTLEHLLAEVSDEQLHDEHDTEASAGNTDGW
jgi:antitoxin MazE